MRKFKIMLVAAATVLTPAAGGAEKPVMKYLWPGGVRGRKTKTEPHGGRRIVETRYFCRGRRNVLVTHPLSEGTHCVLSRKLDVPDSDRAGLRVDVAHDKKGDWVLVVRIDSKTICEKKIGRDTVAKDGWKTVDLSRFAGKKANLDLLNRANGWRWEAGYWSKIEIVE